MVDDEAAARAGRRFEVPVEVVEGQDLDVHRGAVGRVRGPARGGDPGEGAGAHGNAAEKAGPQAPW